MQIDVLTFETVLYLGNGNWSREYAGRNYPGCDFRFRLCCFWVIFMNFKSFVNGMQKTTSRFACCQIFKDMFWLLLLLCKLKYAMESSHLIYVVKWNSWVVNEILDNKIWVYKIKYGKILFISTKWWDMLLHICYWLISAPFLQRGIMLIGLFEQTNTIAIVSKPTKFVSLFHEQIFLNALNSWFNTDWSMKIDLFYRGYVKRQSKGWGRKRSSQNLPPWY